MADASARSVCGHVIRRHGSGAAAAGAQGGGKPWRLAILRVTHPFFKKINRLFWNLERPDVDTHRWLLCHLKSYDGSCIPSPPVTVFRSVARGARRGSYIRHDGIRVWSCLVGGVQYGAIDACDSFVILRALH